MKMPYIIGQAEELWSYKTQASHESQSSRDTKVFVIFLKAPGNEKSTFYSAR